MRQHYIKFIKIYRYLKRFNSSVCRFQCLSQFQNSIVCRKILNSSVCRTQCWLLLGFVVSCVCLSSICPIQRLTYIALVVVPFYHQQKHTHFFTLYAKNTVAVLLLVVKMAAPLLNTFCQKHNHSKINYDKANISCKILLNCIRNRAIITYNNNYLCKFE